mmetsp:Transcript_105297/g.339657  ORF Transcript_105297/g.339657 Transcript_105297/m.339657 type:complete len:146 (+) Transcript_105297:128-565(+)
MVLGGKLSHPAGGYKDQWREHDFYKQAGDTMYEPTWLEKDIKTWKSIKEPISRTMPGSLSAAAFRSGGQLGAGALPRSLSLPRQRAASHAGSMASSRSTSSLARQGESVPGFSLPPAARAAAPRSAPGTPLARHLRPAPRERAPP